MIDAPPQPLAPALTAEATTLTVKQVRRRVSRVMLEVEPAKRLRARRKLTKAVLTAIADGSAPAPRNCAQALLPLYEKIDRDEG